MTEDNWIDTLWKVLIILSPLIGLMMYDVVRYALFRDEY